MVLPILAVTAALTGRGLRRARRLAGRSGRRRDRWPARPPCWSPARSAPRVAVGVSALVGSRGPVIGIMLAFYLAVQNLLLAWASSAARARSSPTSRITRIGDLAPTPDIHVGLGTAIARR